MSDRPTQEPTIGAEELEAMGPDPKGDTWMADEVDRIEAEIMADAAHIAASSGGV
ncbi:MAG: hypothetical protein LBI64_03675 [Coriobacteriales bacterium]|jgi:hypothetical protein|nr:hypothetical protein [Coriobacteriales bacterium]